MGVDCRILLPADVRVNDAAKVIGILAGLKPEKNDLGQGDYGVTVKGVEVKSTSVPEMCVINLIGKMVDGEQAHQGYYHFESSSSDRLLMPRSTPFWICVGRGLVTFFGGEVDYCDCDDTTGDFHCRKPRLTNNPESDKPWQDFQDDILAVKPITKTQLKQARQWAAYKDL